MKAILINKGREYHYSTSTQERAKYSGKALEMAILLNKNTTRGNNRLYRFILAIEIFKQFQNVTPEIVELVKMKESIYREILIDHGIWTRKIYEEIRAKVITKIEEEV